MTKSFGNTITITVVALALTAAVANLAPQQLGDRAYGIVRTTPAAVEAAAVSRPVPPCSISTIAGEWAFRSTGKTPDGQDVAGVGTFHLANDGTSSSHGWTNVGGVFFFESSFTGTTTVDADCTGTQVWEGAPSPAKLVILRKGREIWAVYDVPQFFTVILKRIDEPL